MAQGVRRTHKDFSEEVSRKNNNYVEFLEEYVNYETKILIRYRECSHVKKVHPSSLLKGVGCKTCADKRLGDMKRKSHEKFVAEVQQIHGDELTVLSRYRGNKNKVLMAHNTCGKKFERVPSDILKGKGCPKCAIRSKSDSARKTQQEFVEITQEIDPEGEYIFNGEYRGYNTKIPYTHTVCGKDHEITLAHFVAGRRCPRCSKVYEPSNEEFKERVRELVGDEYTFLEEYKTAKTKIKVRHERCRFVYSVSPDNFLRGRRCPQCKESRGEERIRLKLDDLGIDYIQEYEIKTGSEVVGKVRADFFLPEYNSIIEYDGEQHFGPVEIWGGEEQFEKQKKYDEVKYEYCLDNKIEILLVSYKAFDNIDEIVRQHIERLEGRR